MLVIAHRGNHAEHNENTLAAFEAAVELDVDGIETDVRISSDDYLVLIHDRIISGREVCALTRKEIEHETGYRVSTLDEALECFSGIIWNVEIKTRERLELIIQVLEKYQSNRTILVTSFRHDVIAICASSLKVDCGLIVAHRPLSLNSLLVGSSNITRINHIVWDYDYLDGSLLKESAAAGYNNFVYGLETKSEFEYCKGIDVDGVITDSPFLMEYK
jgi:glycerophosphoryl diester phosphodiesterase